MAVTKIKPIKSTIAKSLAYICNPDKTEESIFVSSYGCTPELAALEFEFLLKNARQGGKVLGHHLMQAFKPDEISPEDAHELGTQLADEILGGKYAYVIATHVDKNHIHNHIIFCAVNMENHHRFICNKATCWQIRSASDRHCAEHGLSVIFPKGRGKNYKVYIDLQAEENQNKGKGFEQWAKINNLKLAASTLVYLQQHGLDSQVKIETRYNELLAEMATNTKELKFVENDMKSLKETQGYLRTVQQTKEVYKQFQSAKNQDKLYIQHESEIRVYEHAKKSLAGVKLTSKDIKAILPELEARKSHLYMVRQKMKDEHKILTDAKLALLNEKPKKITKQLER